MANRVNSYISLEEFKVMQMRELPYEGYVRGVGYTYPEYFPLEFPMDWSAMTPHDWTCKPVFVQAMDTSQEAIIQSLQISGERIQSLLMQPQGTDIAFNMGNGRIITVPMSAKINFVVNIDYESLQLNVMLDADLGNGDRITQITTSPIKDISYTFGIHPALLYPKEEANDRRATEEKLEEPGFWESMIPIWGSGKAAYVNFYNGNYGWGTFYVALAVSDVFLVSSLWKGVAKGAWKTGSHTWGATRKWLFKRGYAKRGEHVHHWLIHQKTGKKYHIEWLVNQPWNLKTFKNRALHERFGHMHMFEGENPGNILQHIWYGTPMWPKATSGSYGGRLIYETVDDFTDNEE